MAMERRSIVIDYRSKAIALSLHHHCVIASPLQNFTFLGHIPLIMANAAHAHVFRQHDDDGAV